MNFSEKISSLQSSAERQLHALGSKKKTENALVLPFFDVLGYNPFDVREVEPDYEIRRGEQGTKTVDYAVKKEGTPIMLFQCVEAKADLDVYERKYQEDGSLLEHFDELEADVAAFTNGLTYRFYANLKADIKVAERPFLKFSLLGYESDQIQALKQLSKPLFDSGEIRSAAYDLQTGQLLRRYFAGQRKSPDDRFVRFLAAQIYDGEVSSDQIERFRPLVQEVLGEFVEAGEEVQPLSRKEAQSPPEQTKATASPDSEPESEGTSLSEELSDDEEELSDDEDDEDESGPFDKDLANRVIDDF